MNLKINPRFYNQLNKKSVEEKVETFSISFQKMILFEWIFFLKIQN
jgi:hypothetical protein